MTGISPYCSRAISGCTCRSAPSPCSYIESERTPRHVRSVHTGTSQQILPGMLTGLLGRFKALETTRVSGGVSQGVQPRSPSIFAWQLCRPRSSLYLVQEYRGHPLLRNSVVRNRGSFSHDIKKLLDRRNSNSSGSTSRLSPI